MSSEEYRDSLRRYSPRVHVNGRQVESAADGLLLAVGRCCVEGCSVPDVPRLTRLASVAGD